MARPVGRVSAASSIGLALLAALGFFAAATWSGEAPPNAIVGGTVWVFTLSIIVATPVVAAWIRRRRSDAGDRGDAA